MIDAFDPPLTPPSKGGELEAGSEPPLLRGAGGILQKLQDLTQADIAASNDTTGFGGDWELETQVGNIETAAITPTNYDYILANPVANADSKALAVSASPTNSIINVLGNDTGTGRFTVESIDTTGTNGTVTINDWIYIDGYFTSIGGQTRNYIARLNSDGSVDPTFNPNADNWVYDIVLDSSGNPIVGGWFTSIGGQPRNYIAKLDPTTGAADATFNPNANNVNNGVEAITIDPKRDILYAPAANFNGVDSFTYTARDSNGVSSPTTVTVLVNDSPVLDSTGTPTLNPQNQNDSNSSGTLVSTIIANLGGSKIVDPNASALQGIAITALDTTNGTWQYTIDGTTWNACPTVSATNALLLASDTNTKLRFVPNAGYYGTISNVITFAAWDQITGTNGTTADYSSDLSTNGISSVFSSATETADITINPLPIIASVTVPTNGNYKIGDVLNFTVNFSESVTITGSPTLPITLNTGSVVNATLNGTGASATSHNFTYTIASGNLDLDGITVGTALNLPAGATIQNINSGNAILNLNSIGSTANVFVDGVVPTVAITSNAANLVNAPFQVTATFSEAIAGFAATDITVGNGTVANFQTTDNITYTFDVIPAADGNVTVDVAANSAADNLGNNNIAASQLTRIANIVNDAPTLTNISRTGDEDTDIVLTANDFVTAFSDVDNDSLSQIKITSLPSNGILKLSGTEVTLNQVIIAADLNNLTFTPDANFTGTTSFTWNGYDG